MPPLNQLFKLIYFFFGVGVFLISCGDHSKPVVTVSTSTPIINITSGPYVVVVNKDLIVGVETRFAAVEPIYTVIPLPVGIAIVNKILPGQIFVTGIKAGSTTFTLSDLANTTAVARTFLVTVNDAPSLVVKPNPLTGALGQKILVQVSTLNPESTPVFVITVSDTSIGRILDVVNDPLLIDLIKVGTTNVIVEDTANALSENFTLTVTP